MLEDQGRPQSSVHPGAWSPVYKKSDWAMATKEASSVKMISGKLGEKTDFFSPENMFPPKEGTDQNIN